MSELKASLAAGAATQIHAFPDEEKNVDMMDMSCNSSSPLDEGQAHVLENGTSGPPLDSGSSFKARLRTLYIYTISFEFRDPDKRVKRSIYFFYPQLKHFVSR